MILEHDIVSFHSNKSQMSSLQQVFDQGANHKKTIALKQLECMYKCTNSAELLDLTHPPARWTNNLTAVHQNAERSCRVLDLRSMV